MPVPHIFFIKELQTVRKYNTQGHSSFFENIYNKADWYLLSQYHLSLKLFCCIVPRNYTFYSDLFVTLYNKRIFVQ